MHSVEGHINATLEAEVDIVKRGYAMAEAGLTKHSATTPSGPRDILSALRDEMDLGFARVCRAPVHQPNDPARSAPANVVERSRSGPAAERVRHDRMSENRIAAQCYGL
jgi:hypothetical protein